MTGWISTASVGATKRVKVGRAHFSIGQQPGRFPRLLDVAAERNPDDLAGRASTGGTLRGAPPCARVANFYRNIELPQERAALDEPRRRQGKPKDCWQAQANQAAKA